MFHKSDCWQGRPARGQWQLCFWPVLGLAKLMRCSAPCSEDWGLPSDAEGQAGLPSSGRPQLSGLVRSSGISALPTCHV